VNRLTPIAKSFEMATRGVRQAPALPYWPDNCVRCSADLGGGPCCSFCFFAAVCLKCLDLRQAPEGHWACDKCASHDHWHNPSQLHLITDAEAEAREQQLGVEDSVDYVTITEVLEREKWNGQWGYYCKTIERDPGEKCWIATSAMPLDLLDAVETSNRRPEKRRRVEDADTEAPPNVELGKTPEECKEILQKIIGEQLLEVAPPTLMRTLLPSRAHAPPCPDQPSFCRT
jgi:hypothetical protein